MAKLTLARVLADVPAHGLKAGSLLEASAELITALAKTGEVDPHKDAVAYAKEIGAPLVHSAIEVAAAERAAAADALRVRVAELEGLLAKATDEATKNALSGELLAQRAALDALAA